MRVHILGSGTSTGVPVIGCTCEVCQSSDPKNKRTRASIAVVVDEDRRFLIDTAPEMRLQILAAGIPSINAVLYTHMHADHTQGFDDLRAFYFKKRQTIPTYLLAEYEDEFRRRFAYAFEETGYLGAKPQIDLRFIPEKKFVIDEVEIEPIVLPHGHVRSCGFRFGEFAYVTDFKGFSKAQIAAWRGKVKVMVASGIHFREHGTHSVIPETLDLFAQLGVEKGVISHLSHEVEHTRDRSRLPRCVEFAYDGMVIDL
ncbi:MAG: MBL fold metallo-hydrolase [Oligoflexus sp.]